MKVGDYVKVFEIGDIGIVESIEDGEAWVSFGPEDVDVFEFDMLQVIEPIQLSESDLRNIFTLNVKYMDYVDELALLGNYQASPYMPTVDDLLNLLMNIKIKNITVRDYQTSIFEVNVILHDVYLPQSEPVSTDLLDETLLKTKGDLFTYIMNCLDCSNMDEDIVMNDAFSIDDFIAVVSAFKKSGHLPIEKREYADNTKENYLLTVQDNDLIDTLKAPYDQMFVSFAQDLVDKDNQIGLEVLGYCFYGGNKLYECDWNKSQMYFENLYHKWGDPAIANSLGYIYYYGRTNNSSPQYDKAFEMFSVGAAAGIYESKYKLADMFNNGYHVHMHKGVADRLIDELYEENYKIISKGFFDCKFADVALRKGQSYLNGNHNDYQQAYYHFLQADFAIRKRMEMSDYYGDLKVFDSIQRSLETCRNHQYFQLEKHIDFYVTAPFEVLLLEDYRLNIKIKEMKGSKLKITACRIPKRREYEPAKVLLPFYQFGGCYYTDSITITAFDVLDFDGEYQFKCSDVKLEDGTVVFYDDEKVMAQLQYGHFRMANPIKKVEDNEYRFAKIKMEDGTLEDYLCSDIQIQPGDMVWVMVNSFKKKLQVVDTFVRKAEMMDKPIALYLSVEHKTDY